MQSSQRKRLVFAAVAQATGIPAEKITPETVVTEAQLGKVIGLLRAGGNFFIQAGFPTYTVEQILEGFS